MYLLSLSLYCLFFFDLRYLIMPFISSNLKKRQKIGEGIIPWHKRLWSCAKFMLQIGSAVSKILSNICLNWNWQRFFITWSIVFLYCIYISLFGTFLLADKLLVSRYVVVYIIVSAVLQFFLIFFSKTMFKFVLQKEYVIIEMTKTPLVVQLLVCWPWVL
jgi:hypothetical protein